jgi:hypothetical protein
VAARHTILRVAVALVLAGILAATLVFVALPAS